MSVKKGWLTKEGEIVKSWKKRWFVLGTETLSYYKNTVSADLDQKITLKFQNNVKYEAK